MVKEVASKTADKAGDGTTTPRRRRRVPPRCGHRASDGVLARRTLARFERAAGLKIAFSGCGSTSKNDAGIARRRARRHLGRVSQSTITFLMRAAGAAGARDGVGAVIRAQRVRGRVSSTTVARAVSRRDMHAMSIVLPGLIATSSPFVFSDDAVAAAAVVTTRCPRAEAPLRSTKTSPSRVIKGCWQLSGGHGGDNSTHCCCVSHIMLLHNRCFEIGQKFVPGGSQKDMQQAN